MMVTARFLERRALDKLPQENHLSISSITPFVRSTGLQLLVAKNYASWGEVTQITIDARQRFVTINLGIRLP